MRKELHLNCGNEERLIKDATKKRDEDLRAQILPDIYVHGTELG
jgi:hypothetical protein